MGVCHHVINDEFGFAKIHVCLDDGHFVTLTYIIGLPICCPHRKAQLVGSLVSCDDGGLVIVNPIAHSAVFLVGDIFAAGCIEDS